MESASVLIAMVSAIMQGVQTWLATKDRLETKRAQESAFERTLESDTIKQRATRLLAIVPEITIERLRQKIQECFEQFNEMLDNEDEFFPAQIDKAAEHALPSCVCRNLKRIVDINGGSLPDRELQAAWVEYRCQTRSLRGGRS